MIQAEHRRWARALFHPYIDREMRKSFHAFYLLNDFPYVPHDRGLLITPNHMSWWDGFFINKICRVYHPRLFHIMMLERQLERYWFFKKLGAFSIEPGDPRSSIESLHYTGSLLRDGHIAVLYPQGVLEPYDKRPIEIKRGGIFYLLNKYHENFYVLPAGFKINFFEEKHPEIVARFGPLLDPNDIRNNLSRYEEIFVDNINKLDEGAYKRNFKHDLFI